MGMKKIENQFSRIRVKDPIGKKIDSPPGLQDESPTYKIIRNLIPKPAGQKDMCI